MEAISQRETAKKGFVFFLRTSSRPIQKLKLIKWHLENMKPSLILFSQNISLEPSAPFQPDIGVLRNKFFWMKSRALPLRLLNSLKIRILTHIVSNLLMQRLTWSLCWSLPRLPFGSNWPGHTKNNKYSKLRKCRVVRYFMVQSRLCCWGNESTRCWGFFHLFFVCLFLGLVFLLWKYTSHILVVLVTEVCVSSGAFCLFSSSQDW